MRRRRGTLAGFEKRTWVSRWQSSPRWEESRVSSKNKVRMVTECQRTHREPPRLPRGQYGQWQIASQIRGAYTTLMRVASSSGIRFGVPIAICHWCVHKIEMFDEMKRWTDEAQSFPIVSKGAAKVGFPVKWKGREIPKTVWGSPVFDPSGLEKWMNYLATSPKSPTFVASIFSTAI